MTMPRIGNLREYLASTGATGALIAGAIVAFLSAGALVAFDGTPLGGDDADGSVSLAGQPGGIAPERAAAALGVTPGAVAKQPFGGSVLAAALPGGAAAGGPGGDGGSAAGEPIDPLGGAGGVSGAVDGIDQTTGGSGLPSLGETAGSATDPVDDAVNDAANGVGGLIGNQNSGNGLGNGLGGLGG
jgi:hypothetical protein